ncbi:MAG: crossover junction endodeoxyribonuclease RuvC [Candidatus Woykebacteria bacterium RIFCSPHIGHO2_12_FULL_43_10]|uniref:Crossover junction endodeoxyribonuclease RuvC n=2 Tax=Candidatus Woykeibacteriota TaxID=1817899 RepID=A0A1G1WXY0_9BACT|nr:MAG: crossover junction endodeoxyribonuclease RuvC [Candidatus Woykebacteria bacterium RIFCSPHIGHO2_01_FULL_43_29]OGY29201.1 MAG: crossover junction endodeoxyribonuclease RuvC [Candidatus Woykebacteria bacterium RIFCSPHIGHO2_12_FULL_43_10]OGY30015.1 MAG: crossover junction endodeoxyribonuclease RuvC [Candidatus Woykebacteria bacterium RIFCSPHIGHO2_02_FULL_43_16b]OGY31997.1 MAG: crossover junction endodeoxyribonuclease RuvC [Candidatus Woykebacteria bacterium RIFCSPLOWO2_01_FULL_43_14]
MLILGIDPGTAATGWGLINNEKGIELELLDYGCFETPKEMEMPARLLMLYDKVSCFITERKPDLLVIEQLFFGVNSTTAMSVGQARGVVLLTAARAGIQIKEYQGLAVKRLMTGYGRAKKKEVQEAVKNTLKLSEIPKPDDAADALGVIICHIYKQNGYVSLEAEGNK